MTSTGDKIEEYFSDVPSDREEILRQVRQVIMEKLPEGYVEMMNYGMISYCIPLQRYPETYNGKPLTLLSLGNQKKHMALYLNNIYADKDLRDWFVKSYKSSGKKLDMGKSCVRFRSLEDLPLDLIGEVVGRTSPKDFIAMYENSRRK